VPLWVERLAKNKMKSKQKQKHRMKNRMGLTTRVEASFSVMHMTFGTNNYFGYCNPPPLRQSRSEHLFLNKNYLDYWTKKAKEKNLYGMTWFQFDSLSQNKSITIKLQNRLASNDFTNCIKNREKKTLRSHWLLDQNAKEKPFRMTILKISIM